MILINAPKITDIVSLRSALQDAIRLELFTIPPYLTALYTLTGSSAGAQYARTIIRNIVRDEMLHMNLVCNILNAIGGTPEINVAGTIPTYPKPLPMALAGGVEVHLKRYSHDLVRDVFMEIEKPETPIELPIKKLAFAAGVAGPKTIGEFYRAIRAEIIRQGQPIFTGSADKQVTGFFFAAEEDISVVDVATATKAIDTIVDQGEGTSQGPSDLQQDIAHFYRFQELDKGMKIVPDPFSPFKYSFDPSKPVVIDDSDIAPMVDDPQNVTFDASDSDAAALSDQCDAKYSEILDTLQIGYTKDRDQLFGIDDTMRDDFGKMIKDLVKFELHGPHAGLRAGPRYKYIAKP
jgi:hypothetical protein